MKKAVIILTIFFACFSNIFGQDKRIHIDNDKVPKTVLKAFNHDIHPVKVDRWELAPKDSLYICWYYIKESLAYIQYDKSGKQIQAGW